MRGPKEGSVMFCVATAPTPARACAQRAATAGEDDAIATPNMRVCVQRAAIENVIGQLSSGITAMTSTSTSHSGRASPATTMPVDTG
jgi:hypothetical protein